MAPTWGSRYCWMSKWLLHCWTLTLVYVLFLYQVSLGFDFLPPGVTLTSNKRYLAAGDTLEITCSSEDNGRLEIHRGGKSLSEYATETRDHVEQIVVPNVKLSDSGQYHCYRDNYSLPISLEIVVGYPPPKPRDIRCVSMNLENMTCTWDPIRTPKQLNTPTNWTLFYAIGLGDFPEKKISSDFPVSACHNALSTPHPGCRWFLHDPVSMEYDFKPGYSYLIWVLAQNVLGRMDSDRMTFRTPEIVKTTPPTHLKASPGNTSSLVNLTWRMSLPGSLMVLKFVYNLTITCDDCVTPERSQFGPIKSWKSGFPWIEVAVDGLEPFVTYLFTVRVKTKRHGYWSKPSASVRAKTLTDVPGESPSLSGSSFSLLSTSTTKAQLALYWKPPQQKFRNGLITAYTLRLTALDKPADTLEVLVNPPLLTAVLEVDQTRVYLAEISASTSKGAGPYSNSLFIPSFVSVRPSITVVITESNTSHVRVLWEMAASVSGDTTVTLHYCMGEFSHLGASAGICQSDYQWQKINPNKTSAVLSVPKDKQKHLLFGVSVEGHWQYGGIVWSQCLFKQDGVPSPLRALTLEEVREQRAEVSWERLSCVRGQARVLYYQTSHCQNQCLCGQGLILNHSGGWWLEGTRIPELTPSTGYTVCVRGVGAEGPGPWSQPLSLITLTPTPVGLIAGCSVAGFILLLLLVFCLRGWYYMRLSFSQQIEPPKPVEMLYMDGYTDEYDTSKGNTQGDHRYSACLGEQEPLMTKGNGEWKGPLQHFPVSNDSGNDSLSEGSHPSIETPDNNSNSDREEALNNNEKEKFTAKCESGFFDSVSFEVVFKDRKSGGENMSPKESGQAGLENCRNPVDVTNRDQREQTVNLVQEGDSGNVIAAYSKFCRGEKGSCSGDSCQCSTSSAGSGRDSLRNGTDYETKDDRKSHRLTDPEDPKREKKACHPSSGRVSEFKNINENNCLKRDLHVNNLMLVDELDFEETESVSPKTFDDGVICEGKMSDPKAPTTPTDVVPYVQISAAGNVAVCSVSTTPRVNERPQQPSRTQPIGQTSVQEESSKETSYQDVKPGTVKPNQDTATDEKVEAPVPSLADEDGGYPESRAEDGKSFGVEVSLAKLESETESISGGYVSHHAIPMVSKDTKVDDEF